MMIKLRIMAGLLLLVVSAFWGTAQDKVAGEGPDISELIDRLNTRDWDKAVEDLIGIGEPAVDPLIDALGRSERFIPGRACIALARIGTPAAVAAVYGAFRRPNIRTKDDVVSALAFLKTETSESLLIEALGDGSLRGAAARALGVLGSREAVGPLAAMLKDGAWYHREAAARALGSIRSTDAVPALLGALEDETRSVRLEARTALAAISGPAVAPLLAALAKAPPAIRWQIVWALGHIGGKEVPSVLVEELKNSDWMVRSEAAVALSRLKAAGIEKRLIRLLSDPRDWVREEAAWVLGEMGTERVIEPLSSLLRDRDSGWMAAAALGRMVFPAAVDPLIEAMRTGPAKTRQAAAYSLSRLNSPKAAEAMSRAANDDVEEVRFWANSGRAAAAETRNAPEPGATRADGVSYEGKTYPVYPKTMGSKPDLPSPWKDEYGREYVVALTVTDEWAVVAVTPENGEEARRQLYVDDADFFALARRGLHSEAELGRTRTITGRSIAEITDLGRPGGLSTDGFMTDKEDILSVLAGDNLLVTGMGLSHLDLARPLFHIWNMILADTRRNLWNMAIHRWDRIRYILFNGKEVLLDAGDTKGVQKSIFEDGLEGYFWIEIGREWKSREEEFLRDKYGHLPADRLSAMMNRLSRIRTGEMEPHYIRWYGFYEGHTSWRTDPLAIAFVFGLKSIEDLERAFPGKLEEVLMKDFAR